MSSKDFYEREQMGSCNAKVEVNETVQKKEIGSNFKTMKDLNNQALLRTNRIKPYNGQ